MIGSFTIRKRLKELFFVSLKLGLTSFGGPTAHLGYFYHEYVKRKKWLDEKAYADLVSLCQFLPGPASSQVGIGIGIMRGGILGGIVSFLGFTTPSVIALMVFAMLINNQDFANAGWIQGLKIVAAVIVLQAVLSMGKQLANEKKTASIAIGAAVITLLWESYLSQILVLLIAGLIGRFFLNESTDKQLNHFSVPIKKRTGLVALGLFAGLLILLPIISSFMNQIDIFIFDRFYRSGALVFGGGHVVLPLLEKSLVPEGLMTKEFFLAGYGAAQAVPGPLFTFAAFLGSDIHGWVGALIATFAIFLPAFLLVIGVLPFWEQARKIQSVQKALKGINAGVVGILLSAFYDPIFTSAILLPSHIALAACLFGLLIFWKLPPWSVVLLGAGAGLIFWGY
ncbi:chromate efflux transporter [Bacillus sp. 03113]|uniref:chromate efflux transporter n=1 Tax=Bacillus sp. 03113 TaxID=2578211 RepID=UPI001142056F|nr:chromate efflux transporter [Bacillus sp. 03113]